MANKGTFTDRVELASLKYEKMTTAELCDKAVKLAETKRGIEVQHKACATEVSKRIHAGEPVPAGFRATNGERTFLDLTTASKKDIERARALALDKFNAGGWTKLLTIEDCEDNELLTLVGTATQNFAIKRA